MTQRIPIREDAIQWAVTEKAMQSSESRTDSLSSPEDLFRLRAFTHVYITHTKKVSVN